MSDEIKKEAIVANPTIAPAAPVAQTAAVVQPTMAEVLHDPNAPVITIKKLLEAGAHFGHQTRRWNPKMNKFIYGARNGIYIINLITSVDKVNEAYKALKSIVDLGGKVLFVGTKPQAQQIVIDEATRSGSFYITKRWLGGTLTNFRTILGRIKYLKDLEDQEASGAIEKLPKKEAAVLRKEKDKLSRNLEGIKEMRRVPQALVVVDPTLEKNAVLEARKLKIPVFAITDTSDNPDVVDFPLPSNNDAASAIKLLIGAMADAVVESKGGVTEIAHVKDQGEEATMKDAIRVADIANEQRRAAIRAARKARDERFAKLDAERGIHHSSYGHDDNRGSYSSYSQSASAASAKPATPAAAAPAAPAPKAEGEAK